MVSESSSAGTALCWGLFILTSKPALLQLRWTQRWLGPASGLGVQCFLCGFQGRKDTFSRLQFLPINLFFLITIAVTVLGAHLFFRLFIKKKKKTERESFALSLTLCTTNKQIKVSSTRSCLLPPSWGGLPLGPPLCLSLGKQRVLSCSWKEMCASLRWTKAICALLLQSWSSPEQKG